MSKRNDRIDEGIARFRAEFQDQEKRSKDERNVISFPGSSSDASPPRTPISFFGKIVPGIIAGAADLDPAAVLTATVAGATFGLSVGWVVLFCIPILIVVFGVSARIGHETKLGLVAIVRQNFGVRMAFTLAFLVAVVNVMMIVADIMAVSEGLSIVLQQPRAFFPAAIAFSVWFILSRVGYERVNRTLSLLALFLFAYVGAAYLSIDSVFNVAQSIVMPRLSIDTAYLMGVIAVFGSLLTPDVIVWQTGTKRERGAILHEIEATVGCIVAALVSLSVIVASSAIHVAEPTSMTARQAAMALARLGEMGPILFALGIMGSGLVALPILVASLCFSISEAAGWKYGLSEDVWDAPMFFSLICFVLFAAVSVGFIGINIVKTLYWSQVVAGFVLVPILFFILVISNSKRIMLTTNTRWQNSWLGGALIGMFAANFAFLWMVFVK